MEQKSDFKHEIMIYFSILVLTAGIVGISYLKLQSFGMFVILAVASFEVAVVGFYFMHLMTKKKTIHIILSLTFLFFLNLLLWPAWDIAYSPRPASEYTVN